MPEVPDGLRPSDLSGLYFESTPGLDGGPFCTNIDPGALYKSVMFYDHGDILPGGLSPHENKRVHAIYPTGGLRGDQQVFLENVLGDTSILDVSRGVVNHCVLGETGNSMLQSWSRTPGLAHKYITDPNTGLLILGAHVLELFVYPGEVINAGLFIDKNWDFVENYLREKCKSRKKFLDCIAYAMKLTSQKDEYLYLGRVPSKRITDFVVVKGPV